MAESPFMDDYLPPAEVKARSKSFSSRVNPYEPPKPRTPNLEIQEITEQYIKFHLTGIDSSVANSIRRVMIGEVPTIAIDVVDFYENTSPLHDQFLAHRMGLIPLNSQDVAGFKYSSECDCLEGCPQCTVRFTLHVKNELEDSLAVTTADLKNEDPTSSILPVERETGEAPIYLLKLGRNQEIDMRCTAKKGIGKEHAKWSPVAVATYQYEPIIELNRADMQDLSEDQKRKFVDSCPRRVFNYLDERDEVVIEDKMQCVFCEECIKSADNMGKPELVTVKQKEDSFYFTVETTGSLKPAQIVETALAVLQGKLQALGGEVEKYKATQ